MIEEAIGYKFRDHIKETVLFEDQVVEHVLTNHVAERRVFPKRLVQDKIAKELLDKQFKLAAKVNHPHLPAIYNAAISDGYYLYIQQHFEGESLELLATRKNAQKPRDWLAIAVRLTDLCADLQFHGIAFDRLSLKDIILSNRMLLICRRYPVGKASKESKKESPYLHRLFESDTTGVYHSEGKYPTEACLLNLKEMLYQLACAKRYTSVEESIHYHSDRARTSGQKKIYSTLGIEHAVEDIILRLHGSQNVESGGPIRTIEELQTALKNVDIDIARPSIEASAHADPDTSSGSSQHIEPVSRSSRSSSSDMPFVSSPSSTAAPKPATTESTEAPPESSSSRESKMIGHNIDDDADEDRSYLYPTKPTSKSKVTPKLNDAQTDADPITGGRKSSTSKMALDSISRSGSSTASIPKAPRQPIKIPWGIIFGLLLLGGIVYAGYTFLPMVMKEKNLAPTAAINLSGQQTVQAHTFIEIDATGSTDPEDDNLTYTWSLPNVEDETNYLLEPLALDRSKIQIKFFQPGIYPIQVIVFDGSLRSEPASVVFEVYN